MAFLKQTHLPKTSPSPHAHTHTQVKSFAHVVALKKAVFEVEKWFYLQMDLHPWTIHPLNLQMDLYRWTFRPLNLNIASTKLPDIDFRVLASING